MHPLSREFLLLYAKSGSERQLANCGLAALRIPVLWLMKADTMLIAFSQMKGSSIQGDGDYLGTLSDLVFGGDDFVVRYVFTDLGKWLPGREVPLRPVELKDCRWQSKAISTDLARQSLEESPIVDSALPISRKIERELAQHFHWPIYWGSGVAPGTMPPISSGAESTAADARTKDLEAEQTTDGNLRSASELMHYHIHEEDGEMGSVHDLIVDDECWVVRYVVVDLGSWLPGRKVIFSTSWITQIKWADHSINVDLSKEDVEQSPEYDSNQLINRLYEEQLYDYHGRPAYWI